MTRFSQATTLFFALCCCCAAAFSQTSDRISHAEQLLIDRNFAAAVEELTPLTADGAESADYALFLLAEAQFLQGDHEAAVDTFDKLLAKFPASPWKEKALYRKADCLTSLKRAGKDDKGFDKAGDLLQPKVEALASNARKDQMAESYLKYADNYFSPKEKGNNSDYVKARNLYEKALQLGLTPKLEARVRLQVARCDVETRNYSGAIQQVSKLIEDLPDSEHITEAKLLLARAHLLGGNGRAARRVYRDFLEDYPNDKARAEASFGAALSYNVPSPRSDSEFEMGVKALRSFLESFPQDKETAKAAYWVPLSYYNRNRLDDAKKEFTDYLGGEDGAPEEYVAPARQLLGEIAFRQRYLPEAIEVWREFLKRHPNHSLSPQVQRRLLDTEYLIGQQAYDKKNYEDAADVWKRFQDEHPLDQRNPDIMFMFGQMDYDQEQYPAAIEKWKQLTSKYQGVDAAFRAWLTIGVTQEERLQDYDASAESYAKVTGGQWAAEAQRRLNALKEKKFVVYTERTFTTADQPKLKLLTRNIEKVEFRAYKVDLEDYFRKLHTIQGVDGLDLALIDADQKWEFSLPEYREKKQMETEAPLPFTAPGVYALVCTADKLAATTVVMITDLAIITKATRRDVLVFAEDMRELQSFAGVKVVFSDGAKILAEGVTGEDGVFHTTVDNLKDVNQLRVLASSGTHYASTENSLSGLQYVAGLAPKALIYTDRPLYRPGQTVHLKGIVRKVEKGAYIFTQGDAFELSLVSARGAVVRTVKVALSAFGTFDLDLPLSADVQAGLYNVIVKQDKLTFTGSFEVQDYSLPKIRLEIDLPRSTYLRGEKIEGKVSAKYYYGEPLVSRKVKLRWSDEPEQELTTNDKGEVEFTIDSRRFEEEAVFAVVARLAEEGIVASRNVHVSPVGVQVSLSTLRDVYLTGEKFEVFAESKDLNNDPSEAKLGLRILKKEFTDGLYSERLVETSGLTTHKENGKGSVPVSVKEPGDYILRIHGEDRHGNPVTAERFVTVVGEDDKFKLRILSDKDSFKVGDTADLRVVSRAAKNLALVTYEGEVIYEYQVVGLDTGDNEVRVSMTGKLSPGFVMAVSMMSPPKTEKENNAFHTASKTFEVKGNLRVTVKPDKEKHRPGDKVTLHIAAADPQGRASRAQLSLSAVDASLYAVRPDKTPSLSDYFFQRRVAADTALTATSFTFNYTSTARQTAVEIREADYYVSNRLRVYAGGLALLQPTMEKDGRLLRADKDNARQMGGGIGGVAGPPGTAGPAGAAGKVVVSGALVGLGDLSDRSEATESRVRASRKAEPAAPPPPPLREFFAETAFWKADIVTGEKGEATVSFTLPDSITEWRLTARGITVETLAGDATEKLVSAKDYIAEVKLPEVFQQGDTVHVTVVAHNNTDRALKGGVSVYFGVEGHGGEALRKTVEISANGTAGASFPFTVPDGKAVITEVHLIQGDAFLDSQRVTTPIRPWGVGYVDSAGGLATSDIHAELTLPDLKYSSKRMSITVGPSVESALIEASESSVYVQRGCIPGEVASRGKELTALTAYLRARNQGDSPDGRRLLTRLESEVARLQAAQSEDGGWVWGKIDGASDPFVSADAVVALAEAKRLGLDVSPEKLANALNYLKGAFRRAEESDAEQKSAILYAMGRAGESDFAAVNRLHRLRNSLDARSLALVMLSLCDMDRIPMAVELVPSLEQKARTDESGSFLEESGLKWGGDRVEVTALALLALVKANVKSEAAPDLVKWLWAQRRGNGWASPPANTAAIRALAEHALLSPVTSDRFTLAVRVNGKEIRKLEVAGTANTETIDVPADLIDKGQVLVDFGFSGRGQYAYSCVLTGFSEQVKEEEGEGFQVWRNYYHPPIEYRGKRMKSGISTVDTDRGWENPSKEVIAGRQVVVSGHWLTSRDFFPGGYIVMEEPLPAGCGVVEGTIVGSFERFDKQPGKLVFYFRSENRRYSSGQYRYELYGSLPGDYRALPAKVYSYGQPDLYRFADDQRTLKVLSRDEKLSDTYRMSPDESYSLGKALFDDNKFEESEKRLTDFFDTYRVRPEPAKDTARMLFTIALKTGNAAGTVRFFEVLNERFPDYVVPFADIVRVAKAYREMGESERQVQVCRAIAETSFDVESRIGGVLNQEGEFEASVAFVRDLCLTYPDLPKVEEAFYSLSQFMYGKAAKIDEQMKKLGITKESLIRRALQQIRNFLALHPKQPLTEEATFSLLNAHVDLEQYDEAARLAEAAQKRYPNSQSMDDYQYIRALAAFLGQRFDESLALCEELASRTYPQADGTQAESSYKTLALFITAQVFHARGNADEALIYYERVKEQFSDAKASMEYFQRTGLRLPEVTVVSGGQPAEVKLIYRNLKEADVKVYRVDLLKFYQVHRSLANIANMKLTGIKPVYEHSITLESGNAMKDKELTLAIPADTPGAYFVLVSTPGAEGTPGVLSSGVALRTDLKVEVQEDANSGQVRVNVVNASTGSSVPKAEVWVTGSEITEFRKGTTDLRGVMVAENIRGKATVIASKKGDVGNQYAFHRGETVLQPGQLEEANRRKTASPSKQLEFKDEATRQLRMMNEANQIQRADQFEQQLKGGDRGGQPGVRVQQAN
ncbi:MAG: hypothetical protein COZ56_17645 [Armatimonadetes bacterium CG_4_8_14_3_um_filter_58_9]|nr:MAG: hypothetical protein COZ56_17645 [Armatimonadetes bacterium CG_4_8_14_3_um_filter_58_9]